MGLEHIINQDLKAAMLEKDRQKLAALRAIKAALLLEKTGGSVGDTEIPEGIELKLLQKQVKQRRDTAKIYREQNRPELAEEEEYQAAIIEKYLPEQMSEDEVKVVVEKVIADVGASSMKDMGRVMGMVAKQLTGRADNKTVSVLVKQLLS